MKWVIITTSGKNPGDEFIQIGLSNVITRIDPNASGYIIDKETPNINEPQEFDKCIWAGMPVFWSLNDNSSWNVPWWKALTQGNISSDKDKFCVLGAGSFQDATDVKRGANTDRLHLEASIIDQRSHIVVVRDDVVNNITNMNFDVQVCPAILSTYDMEKTESIKGCNLMPNGAHYSEFNQNESNIWRAKQPQISNILQENKFVFFAHNHNEYQHARTLGWNDSDIIAYKSNPKEMLGHYRNVDQFFGNRVHGCIVSRANGADVISCGYDSRQSAVKLSGATTLLPSEITTDYIQTWACSEPQGSTIQLEKIMKYYEDILTDFMGK